MFHLLDRFLGVCLKGTATRNLKTLEKSYTRASDLLHKILLLSEIDPRPTKIDSQDRIRIMLQSTKIELAGIKTFLKEIQNGTMPSDMLLRIITLSSIQLRQNKEYEENLLKIHTEYDRFADLILNNSPSHNIWVN